MKYRFILLALAALLAAGTTARAQTPEIQQQLEKRLQELREAERKKAEQLKKASLEELLELALKNNPDIRLAEIKVREAEAALSRTRLDVLAKVAAVQANIRAQRAAVKEAETQYERLTRLYKQKVIDAAEVDAIASALLKAKAALIRAEAELPFLIGRLPAPAAAAAIAPDGKHLFYEDGKVFIRDAKTGKWFFAPARIHDHLGVTFTGRFWAERTQRQPTGDDAAKIRAALDTPVTADFRQVQLADVLAYIQQRAKGLNVHNRLPEGIHSPSGSLTVKEPIPLGALLQWVEDQYHVNFIIRDYGVVLTYGKNMPPGAVGLLDFWKNRPAGKKTPPTGTSK